MDSGHMQGFVYFLRDSLCGRPIKIGWSQDPVARCRTINLTLHRGGVQLVGWFPGTRAEERALHVRWARHRVIGEWFRPDPEIVAAIDLCRLLHCEEAA